MELWTSVYSKNERLYSRGVKIPNGVVLPVEFKNGKIEYRKVYPLSLEYHESQQEAIGYIVSLSN